MNPVEFTLDSEHTVHESSHVDPLGATTEPTITGGNGLLTLQVQAFLEASEDVDADAETIEDILQALVADRKDAEDAETRSETQMNEDEDSDGEFEPSTQELDISPLFEGNHGATETWSKQEVKQMLHLLKERGSSAFIEKYVRTRQIPIPKLLHALGVDLCAKLQDRRPSTMLYFLRVAMSHHLRQRDKLPQHNTIADAVELIQKSQRILILTGAGISVSCGIPDFRSRDGLYASLKNQGEYDLDDPQQMFDIQYFRENPSVFYSFASQIYPSNFVPSPCHRFIKEVEVRGKLLRNYTQNIDTLETLAGVEKVLQCHGSFATASCLQCRRRVPGSEIESDILRQKVPLCTVCNGINAGPLPPKGKKSLKKLNGQWDSDVEDESDGPEYPPGIMKPDITFFGEKLTDDFDKYLAEDRFKVDLLLVIGTSLKVSPVAEILSHLPHSLPQILINKTPIRHINPDIVLLGNADDIVLYLCHQLDWQLPPPSESLQSTSNQSTRLYPSRVNLRKRASADDRCEIREIQPRRVGESHVWLFDGAEGGKWLQQLQCQLGIIPGSIPSSAVTSGDNTRQSMLNNGSAKDGAESRREIKKARVR
ncbi:SIR2-domain-containing protein [Phlegmacium glaucopus]|nr:SIR2-domain-containing protein [Phlegmacium glaucopus]